LKHFASPAFWACFEKLPATAQELARQKYDLLKQNPTIQHPISNVSVVSGQFVPGFRTERLASTHPMASFGFGSGRTGNTIVWWVRQTPSSAKPAAAADRRLIDLHFWADDGESRRIDGCGTSL